MRLLRRKPAAWLVEARRQLEVIDFQHYCRAVREATTADEVQAAVDAYEKVKDGYSWRAGDREVVWVRVYGDSSEAGEKGSGMMKRAGDKP